MAFSFSSAYLFMKFCVCAYIKETLLGLLRQRGRRLLGSMGVAVQVSWHGQMGPQGVFAALDRRETAGQ